MGQAERFGPDVRQLVDYDVKPEIEAQFGAYPPIHTGLADSLGFAHDGDARTLVVNALNLSDEDA